MSDWVWGVPLIVAILGLQVWVFVHNRRVVADLARRPDKEFQVAGYDKVAELQRTSTWGTGLFRYRSLRQRLDQAAADIARLDESGR